ncbi:hypothetical protein NW762_004047 [Fusarium torreyae]|uniref:F-box domain-containing protein n=1 Tax=Fusarium torreyae TaxID=1237075 RepID=A0A9W8VGI9_9HYPO|nr:hypothetical protein NW762_004047 [Fusarium torreyae]
MERLAPEIISSIIFYLHEELDPFDRNPETIVPLAPLATLSRQWQPLVEAITFRKLFLNSESLPLAVDSDLLTPRRLSYIRHLNFDFLFPAYETVSTRDEDWDDHAVFATALQQLFELIARIPSGQEPLIKLVLSIPVPRRYEGGDQKSDVINSRLRTIYFEISSEAQTGLPKLPMIRSFSTAAPACSVVFSPRAVCLMASKMPRLREVELRLSDDEKVDPLIRIQQRKGLAHSLRELPPSIHLFFLEYLRDIPIDHDFTPPTIIPQGEEDCLSKALRQFSQREELKDFHFQGSIEPTIFWPLEGSSTTETLHWPSLKSFVVRPHSVLPSGKWLVIASNTARPEGTVVNSSRIPGEDIYRQYRDFPHYPLMNGFFLAAARCVARMPKAEYCSVMFHDAWLTSLDFCTEFPEDPCLKVTGRADPILDKKMLAVWQELAEARDIAFRLQILEDSNYNIWRLSSPDEDLDWA